MSGMALEITAVIVVWLVVRRRAAVNPGMPGHM